VEAVVIFRVCLFVHGSWRWHAIHDIWILIKEFLESTSWDMLDLLFENLINGVATILKHVNQIHHFLLSELQVFDLIFKNATLCLRLTLGFNRIVNLL
jgi:hypothetical protein